MACCGSAVAKAADGAVVCAHAGGGGLAGYSLLRIVCRLLYLMR